jgi:GNAT superfamily N-acetyltransferase
LSARRSFVLGPKFASIEREVQGRFEYGSQQSVRDRGVECKEISDIANFWDGVFAYVGYREGHAVTAAATFLENSRLYVGFVATLPQARRNGYAEAVMRHSLEAAARSCGLSRTVLQATEAGYPVYEAMGYRQVAHFQAYFPQAIASGMSNPA